jgi:hypothetical protein
MSPKKKAESPTTKLSRKTLRYLKKTVLKFRKDSAKRKWVVKQIENTIAQTPKRKTKGRSGA